MAFASARKQALMKGLAVWLVLLAGRLAGADWAAMPAGEFARLPAVVARVDFAHFDPDLMGAAIFHETNRLRARLGLPSFAHLAKLDAAGALKAAVGVVQGELVHENPMPLNATPADRVKAVGLATRQVAENIARLGLFDLPPGETQVEVREHNGRKEYHRLGTGARLELRSYAGFAEEVVRAWMNSPPHRANIVNPELTALGCAARPCRSPVNGHEQVYAVQVFCTPR